MRRKAWVYTLLMWGVCLLVLSLTCVSNGQIVVPAQAEQHTLIPCKLDKAIPEGAYLADGGWEIVGATDKQKASIHECKPTELWFTGAPGSYTVTYDGVMLKDVVFVDSTGKEVKFTSYVGRVKGRSVCVVSGGTTPDPPDPDPDPMPGGPWQIMLFYSEQTIDNLPQPQRDMLTSLALRDWLTTQGHVLQEVADPANLASGSVPERWKPWLSAIQGDALPRIALAPKGGGKIVDFALPATIDELKVLLQSPQGYALKESQR